MKLRLETLYGQVFYQVQYTDDKNAWTVPVILTEERADRFLKDFSVSLVKLTMKDGTELLLDLK